MLPTSKLSARKSLLIACAISRGMIHGQNVNSVSVPVSQSENSAESPLAPIPNDSRSPFADPVLSRSEKRKLANEVLAYHLQIDAVAWEIGKRGRTGEGCAWLLVVGTVETIAPVVNERAEMAAQNSAA